MTKELGISLMIVLSVFLIVYCIDKSLAQKVNKQNREIVLLISALYVCRETIRSFNEKDLSENYKSDLARETIDWLSKIIEEVESNAEK
jgi:hypothetical protein